MSIELVSSQSNLPRDQEFSEVGHEFERRMKKAEKTPADKINPERVQKEWDNAISDFYRDHLTLNVFFYEAIRSMKERGVQESWSPSGHILSRMNKCLSRMKIANEYAKKRDNFERIECLNYSPACWHQCSIITFDVVLSLTLCVFLVENAYAQIFINYFENNSTAVNTTTITPETEDFFRSLGPIIRISMNILSVGFGRIKERVEKRIDKYNQRLGLLEHILGVKDQKSDRRTYESDFQIEDCKAKLDYWEGLANHQNLVTINTFVSLKDKLIQERLDKAIAQLDSWGVDGGGFKKNSWIGDDLSTMYVSDEAAVKDDVESSKCRCGKLFRSSTKYRTISFKRLQKTKEHINGGRIRITLALQSAHKKIEEYQKRGVGSIDLDLKDELTIIKLELGYLESLIKHFRSCPKEDHRKLKKLMGIEKGIKLGVEVTALLIVMYDQYTELVGEPILGVVITAFFMYFISFILARSTDCVNQERQKQTELAKDIAVILKIDKDYVPEIKEMKGYLKRYRPAALRIQEPESKEIDGHSPLNVSEGTETVVEIDRTFTKRLSSLSVTSLLEGSTEGIDLKKVVDECQKESSDAEIIFREIKPKNQLKAWMGIDWEKNKKNARACKLPRSLFLDGSSPFTSLPTDFESKLQ